MVKIEEMSVKVAPETRQLVLGDVFLQGLLESERIKKRNCLGKFFTNLDGRVTAITNRMPSRLSAALTARLSRATIYIRELFWQEFVENEELGLSQLIDEVDSSDSIDSLLREEKSEKMIARIIDKFGDDSVREQASGYVMVQDSSVLASMETFNRGVLITGIEASTRYIPFYERDASGRYRYVEAPKKFNAEEKEVYDEQMDFAFDTYSQLWPQVWKYVESKNPRSERVSEIAHRTAVLGKVCDLLRGLLPLGSKTNFAIHANYRSQAELIISLRSSELDECREMADLMAAEQMEVNPEFIRMVDSDHGKAWTEYLRQTREIERQLVEGLSFDQHDVDEPRVSINVLNLDHNGDILSSMIKAQRPNLGETAVEDILYKLTAEDGYMDVFKKIGDARKNRRHKLPAAFSAGVMAVTLENISMGGIKDINRHRKVLLKSSIVVDGSQGAHIPEELKDIPGAYESCAEVQERAVLAFKKLETKNPHEAKLVLTHGTRASMFMVMDVAEGFWISEIRSMASGNPEYRHFAQMLYKGLIAEMPEIEPLGSYVDNNEYNLGRIGEAVRADLKGRS